MAKVKVILVVAFSWFAMSYTKVTNFRGLPPEAKLNTVSILFDLS